MWFFKKKKKLDTVKDKRYNMLPSYIKQKKVKIGVAFGGGGTRGLAHLGAIKAFEEFGLKFDFISGTSSGSLVGAMYADEIPFQKMYEISKSLKEKDIKTSKLFFMPSKTEGLQEVITSVFGDKNIEDLKNPFAAVAVDIKTTQEVVITKGELKKALAGSCAVPGVFQPVEMDDMILLDGGLQNTIPANVPRLFGCDYVVSVDVNSQRSYGTDSTKLMDVLGVTIRILMKSNAIKGYLNSDIIIQPDTKRFKNTKTDGLDEMIDEGYRATLKVMPEIINLFYKKPNKKKIIESDETTIK